ncbi:MAG: hypothetical protein O7A64_02040 [Alphaproteobacteria bacterium]|jgi:hypothetical protein|nr:hypothetical protein [Alphaproteobacteria bacterium]
MTLIFRVNCADSVMVGSWNDATVRIRRDFGFQVAGTRSMKS